jgi:trehalose 6-phosphate phosphatase
MTAHTRPGPLDTGHALFLDFDGTLAPIQDDPVTVALPEGGADTLNALSRQLGGALAVISGRDLRDLSKRVPDTLWRIGGHGLETCAPGERPDETPPTAPPRLQELVTRAAEGLNGVRIEPKGLVFAIHYRAAPEFEVELGRRLEAALAGVDDYRLERGKMVYETKPSAASKGKALAAKLLEPPFTGRIPVMAGDDTTDEAAMEAAQAAGGWAIKVGEGDTAARYRLPTPAAVWEWLEGTLA